MLEIRTKEGHSANWSNTFNTHHIQWTLEDAAGNAHASGYKYMGWNWQVFLIGSDSNGDPMIDLDKPVGVLATLDWRRALGFGPDASVTLEDLEEAYADLTQEAKAMDDQKMYGMLIALASLYKAAREEVELLS